MGVNTIAGNKCIVEVVKDSSVYQLLSNINFPYILPIIEINDYNIVYEYKDYKSLKKYLNGGLSIDEQIVISLRLINAFKQLADNNIYISHISLDNILYDQEDKYLYMTLFDSASTFITMVSLYDILSKFNLPEEFNPYMKKLLSRNVNENFHNYSQAFKEFYSLSQTYYNKQRLNGVTSNYSLDDFKAQVFVDHRKDLIKEQAEIEEDGATKLNANYELAIGYKYSKLMQVVSKLLIILFVFKTSYDIIYIHNKDIFIVLATNFLIYFAVVPLTINLIRVSISLLRKQYSIYSENKKRFYQTSISYLVVLALLIYAFNY
ncbi:hypothetical protein [Mycoplasma sp. P36-A1]|uniref:hypothetical protein n=1 Tax=Mycoplasma sp. P36-A1 TaxID=3252900 RepID=UPI003C2F2762